MGLILIGYGLAAIVVAFGLCALLGRPHGSDWWLLLLFSAFWPVSVPGIIKWELSGRPEPPYDDYPLTLLDKVLAMLGIFVVGAVVAFCLTAMHELTVQNRPKPAVEVPD